MASPLGATVQTFAVPGFTGLWLSQSSASFGRLVTQVVLGWLTLEATGSPLLVGAVLAARQVPQLLLGIPTGVLADWFERRSLVIVSNALGAVAALAIALAAGLEALPLAGLFAAAFVLGALDMLRMTVTQAYAFDLVRSALAARGLALTNLAGHLFGALGGVVGGYALERLGPAATFVGIGLAMVVAALCPLLWCPPAGAPAVKMERRRADVWSGLALLGRSRLFTMLALTIVLAEILGFSNQTLVPIYARDILDVGASGLGVMTSARSVGGVLGLVLLAGLGTGDRSGALLLLCGAVCGLALVAFASTNIYLLALGLLLVVGAATSALDSLAQTILQRNAAEGERGAAMGIWIFGVGFGPIGHISIGAAAAELGAPLAQALSGAGLVLVVVALALSSSLRRAR